MSTPSDWDALYRLADGSGVATNVVTQIRGRSPIDESIESCGAQALCIHDDDFEGVVLSDGTRIPLQP